MNKWKPKNFKPEYPAPEDGCVFFLGGTLHGEIMRCPLPLPRFLQHAAPRRGLFDASGGFDANAISADIETYRLEEFRVGESQRQIWFYVHGNDATDCWLIKAFTELCMFKRDAISQQAA